MDPSLLGSIVRVRMPFCSLEELDAPNEQPIRECRVSASDFPGRYALLLDESGEQHKVLATPEVLRTMMERAGAPTRSTWRELLSPLCSCVVGAATAQVQPGQSLCGFGTVQLGKLTLACDGSLAGQVWGAGLAMARAFERGALPLDRPVVVELGSGTAVAGLAAGLAGASLVVLTDMPSVVPRLQACCDLNAGPLREVGSRAVSAPLSWGDEAAAEALMDEYCPDGPDLIIATDCMYQPQAETHAALRASLASLAWRRAQRRSGGSHALIWHVYEHRWDDVTGRWLDGHATSGLRIVRERSLDPSPPVSQGRSSSDQRIVLEELELATGLTSL